jgi:hypothetical protein
MAEHAVDVLIAEHRVGAHRLRLEWSQRANAGGPVGAAVAVAVGASLAGGVAARARTARRRPRSRRLRQANAATDGEPSTRVQRQALGDHIHGYGGTISAHGDSSERTPR